MARFIWFLLKSVAGGMVSYISVRVLIGWGVPVDKLVANLIAVSPKTALWIAVAFVALLLFFADRIWHSVQSRNTAQVEKPAPDFVVWIVEKVRNKFHRDATVATAPEASLQMEVTRAAPAEPDAAAMARQLTRETGIEHEPEEVTDALARARVPPGPPWTDSSGRTYDMGEYSGGGDDFTRPGLPNEANRQLQENMNRIVEATRDPLGYDPIRRATLGSSDPTSRLKYLDHNVGLAEAILWVMKGEWGLTFDSFDPHTESSRLDDINWAFEEKAEAGRIEVWGSDQWEGGRYSIIPPEEWKKLKIERQSLREDSPRVTGKDGHSPEPREYYNLRVNRAQIEETWPAESGSVSG